MSTYLIPSHLRVLRQVWQGRVHAEPARNGGIRFTVDSKPASVDTECVIAVLLHDGYAEHHLTSAEEWATVQTTTNGDATLAALGADHAKFTDLSATEARALTEVGQS